jgi:hypothetical protein
MNFDHMPPELRERCEKLQRQINEICERHRRQMMAEIEPMQSYLSHLLAIYPRPPRLLLHPDGKVTHL